MSLLGLRAQVLALSLVVGWPLWAGAAPLSAPTASVSVASDDFEDRLSVTARAVSLRALLSEVAYLAGFEVLEAAPTERTVSVDFSGFPLDRALRQILSGESFVFVYGEASDGGSARLTKVILLGSGASRRDSTGGSEVSFSDGADGVPASLDPPRVVPQGAEAFDPRGPLEHLLRLTAHRDPRMRKAALEALTLHHGDDRARWALMDRIRDPDPKIRAVVLGLVSRFVKVWPGAEEVLLTALRDPAPRVRELAVRRIWEAASPRLSAAVHLALGDEHPRVRGLAGALLRGTPIEDSVE